MLNLLRHLWGLLSGGERCDKQRLALPSISITRNLNVATIGNILHSKVSSARKNASSFKKGFAIRPLSVRSMKLKHVHRRNLWPDACCMQRFSVPPEDANYVSESWSSLPNGRVPRAAPQIDAFMCRGACMARLAMFQTRAGTSRSKESVSQLLKAFYGKVSKGPRFLLRWFSASTSSSPRPFDFS
jgi:hypothetical protein